jgi:hypothetical protein
MQCYLCGTPNPTTRDHVPPKGFFPNPRPADLITLPCCEACNNSYSRDDEAMRVWLSSGLGCSQAAEWITEHKILPGIIERSPAFRTTLLTQMEDITVTDENGERLEAVKFSVDRERADRFITRVAKGLQKHHFPDRDGRVGTWRCVHVENRLDHLTRVEPLRDLLPHFDSRGDEVIQYRYGFTEDHVTCVWLIVFYGSAMFVVMHRHSAPSIHNPRQNVCCARVTLIDLPCRSASS